MSLAENKRDSGAIEKYEAERRRTRQFVALIAKTRKKLETLYGDHRTPEGKIKAASKQTRPAEVPRKGKAEILGSLKEEYVHLKNDWGGATVLVSSSSSSSSSSCQSSLAKCQGMGVRR